MTEDNQPLNEQQVADFKKDGFVILKDFYNRETDIEPIQHAIHKIIGILIEKYGLAITQKKFTPAVFDSGYQKLIAHDRKIGGEVYDAVKQIPAFVRLCAHPANSQIVSQLRETDLPGIAAGGYGIRINNPNEEKFRAEWHQDYHSQLRSLDGIILWSPLMDVTADLGPVQLSAGSHVEGAIPVYTTNPDNPAKTGAYGLTLKDKDKFISKYPVVAPLTSPSDLMVIDFMTLHASGYNMSKKSLWSMQLRYFNFRESTGIKNSWCGSYAAGVDFAKVHPELVAS